MSNFYDNAIPCKGDITHGTGQPDLSHLDQITLRRVLGKLVLTIGDWEHTFSPEQEAKLWEQIQEMMTMTQVEREAQVKFLSDKAATLWKAMGAIMVEGARSGNVCVDLELLRQWQSEVFAIMAGIGPLEWPLPDEHERMKP